MQSKEYSEEQLEKLTATTPMADPTPITIENTDYLIKYPPNSFVYIEKKARYGVLKYVVIKKYDLKITSNTFDQPIILYTDTLNGLWNEDELCSASHAIALATAYYEALIENIDSQS